jgi:hypothetical protein
MIVKKVQSGRLRSADAAFCAKFPERGPGLDRAGRLGARLNAAINALLGVKTALTMAAIARMRQVRETFHQG